MKKLNLFVICLVVVGLVLGSFGCAAPTPAPATPTAPKPAPTSTPSPTSKPTVAPAPTSSPTAKPTSKPTSAAAPVSFAGKTITLVNSTTAGGGADIMSRVYSQYLSKYLPGTPSVIVRNMPGGQSTIAGNYVYKAKPDGTTALVATSGVQIAFATGMTAAQYDLRKMDAIVAITKCNLYIAKAGIVDKAENLPKAKGIVFGYGAGVSGWTYIVAANLLGFHPDRVVLGYEGSADARRAFLAGELNMTVDSPEVYWSNSRPLVEKGELIPLFQVGVFNEKGDMVRDPSLPADVPTTKEVYEKINGKAPSGIAWDAYKGLVAAGESYARVLLLPPDVPASIVAAYRQAVDAMLKDTDFRKKVNVLVGAETPWLTGEAFSNDFKSKMWIDPKVLEWIKGALMEYKYVIE